LAAVANCVGDGTEKTGGVGRGRGRAFPATTNIINKHPWELWWVGKGRRGPGAGAGRSPGLRG